MTSGVPVQGGASLVTLAKTCVEKQDTQRLDDMYKETLLYTDRGVKLMYAKESRAGAPV